MVVVPDARGLVIAADPDDGVTRELPAELEAFEVPLVIRKQVLTEQAKRALLQAQQRVGLNDLVINLGFGCLPVESAYRDGTRKKHELVLQGIPACGMSEQQGQNEQESRNAHRRSSHR